MLKPKDKIVVALSGGKDSIALLYNLMIIQERNHYAEPLVALSIDEGIYDYRDKSIEKAADFCKKYDIEHIVISFKDRIGKTLDDMNRLKNETEDIRYTCNYCAVIRRRLINDGAKELGGDVIAMGHNLTDVAETYLMNILFNRFHLISNQYPLKKEDSEIRNYFLKKITPLMRIPEEEIFMYCNIKKFEYYTSHCPFREEDPILRKRVLDFIQDCKKYSPEIEYNLFNGFMKISELLYNQSESKFYRKCEQCGYPSGNAQICTYCQYVKKFNN